MFKFRFLSFILSVTTVYFLGGSIANWYSKYYDETMHIRNGTVGQLNYYYPPVSNFLIITIVPSLFIFAASYLLFTYIQNRFFK